MNSNAIKADLFQSEQWFRKQTETFKDRWNRSVWHDNGERALMPLKQSLRKYASCINKLPDGFIPSVFDQHLAVLSEGYEYQILDIQRPLGDDRFLCKNVEGEEFCLWSHSVAINQGEGRYTFLSAVIRLDDKAESSGKKGVPVPAITYGPVIAWKSLFTSDFSRLARSFARDLLALKGLPAVIRRDPVPFWALWTLGDVPRIMHGTEEVCTCWVEGLFTGDPAPLLSGWKRDAIGKRIRFRKSGSKPFFEQVVIYDVKTMRGLILARRNSYLGKLFAALETIFSPDPDGEGYVTPVCEMALSDVLKTTPEYKTWTAAFDREDERIAEAKDARHPERKVDLASFNAAMQDLLPYVNSGTEPDWLALGTKHALSVDRLESLKGMYGEFVKKLR